MEVGPSQDVSCLIGTGLRETYETNFFLVGPSNCTDLVANQPDSFKTAFWEFGAFEVYQSA